jgi:hypothetical protein
MPNIVSITVFPRYKFLGRDRTPVVQEATRRVLYSDSTVTLETITAAAYEDATGAETDALCVALDRHPRERA